MKLQLNKENDITVDSWVNDRMITDKNWECWSCENPDGGVTILLKEPNGGQNIVKFIINKNVKFEEMK